MLVLGGLAGLDRNVRLQLLQRYLDDFSIRLG